MEHEIQAWKGGVCGQDGCDTEKAARSKDWRFVRSERSWSGFHSGRASESHSGMPGEISNGCHHG